MNLLRAFFIKQPICFAENSNRCPAQMRINLFKYVVSTICGEIITTLVSLTT